ncbi:MAG: hypothetical protein AAB019_12415 [Planctomycetota bacterium]
MGQRFVLWLGRAGRRLVGGFFTVIFYLIVAVLMVAIMEFTNNFIIDPAINNFGRAVVMSAMIFIAVAALIGVYSTLAVTLWRRSPIRPSGIGRLRWLLTIYGKNWRQGLGDGNVHKMYFLLVLVVFFGLMFEASLSIEPDQAVFIMAVGIATPVLAATTVFQPLLGSFQLKEAIQKT